MLLQEIIERAIRTFLKVSSDWQIGAIQKTKKEFTGDFSINIFPIYRSLKTGSDLNSYEELKKYSAMPIEQFAVELSDYLKANVQEIESINTIKGFINILLKDAYWSNFFSSVQNDSAFGVITPGENSETVMVEFSSPNTNKPLHLGHVRNNLLGASVSGILKAAGKKVIRVNLVNDRGIHICKSMLAWKKWGGGETPELSEMKGDHLVGKYYVKFDTHYKLQIAEYKSKGMTEEEASKKAPLLLEIQEMLRKWEAGDKETIDLWKKMNGWVYAGFAKTYKDLGIEFEKTYYESETYLLGKKIVDEGLRKDIFKKKEDGSVWIDLTADGLDEKLVLRSDGTSVYITQDLGTIMQRLQDFRESKINKLIYVVGNEQDYHFKVLFLIIRKLINQHVGDFSSLFLEESGEGNGKASLFHLSYGMVDLPSGKMKSREGTVVDADELMDEMVNTARETTKALGKTEGMNEAEAETLYRTIGLGALKYFILKVDPKKRMLFDPKESIDFNGNTGPFIQYTYTRIKSVLRKAEIVEGGKTWQSIPSEQDRGLHSKEKAVIKLIYDFPKVISEAADSYNPGHIANYMYELAKEYNQFYHEVPILKSENVQEKEFRLSLSAKTAEVIKTSLTLLGINAAERM